MANLLKTNFRKKVEKDPDPMMSAQSTCPVGYPSGLAVLDHMNGKTIYVEDIEGNLINKYKSVGFRDGSLVTFIGKPGTGKTTMAIQTACNIVKKYDHGMVIHEDPEGGSDRQRIRAVGNLSNKEMEEKYDHKDIGITSENFYKRTMIHCDLKKEMRDDLLYDTGLKDEMGKPLKKVTPSFIILDSLASLMPERYSDEEEMSGQMSATQAAKVNTMMLKRLMQHIRFNNVNLLFINHITTNVNTGYGGPKKQLQYLKQDERCPGGRAALFYANNILKLKTGKSFSKDDMYGIEGNVVYVTLVKSRSNRAGQSFKAIFNKFKGFDNILTIVEFLKDKKVIKAGAWNKLKGYDGSFRNANIHEKVNTDKEFRKALFTAARIELEKLIPDITESTGQASEEQINEALSDIGLIYSDPEEDLKDVEVEDIDEVLKEK